MYIWRVKQLLMKNSAWGKTLVVLVSLTIFARAGAQVVDNYLDGIRNNKAALTAFFSAMPKGGDLHNHFTGSLYTETYLDYVINRNYYLNTQTLEVAKAPGKTTDWQPFSALQQSGQLDAYKQKLIQIWSVKDYNGISSPSDKLFFGTFPLFSVASQNIWDSGLLELKTRAVTEHVNYIETMTSIPGDDTVVVPAIDAMLVDAGQRMDEQQTTRLLDSIYNAVKGVMPGIAAKGVAYIQTHHNNLKIDDDNFTLRYQLAFVRVINPTLVFKKMVLAFEGAAQDKSGLIGGVNILAPENNDISMRDYWLHMQMFKYLRAKAQYKDVKCSLHAGELVLGMVKPEQLTWHIYDAVHVAGANRIGHGVDIPYEHDCYNLLKYMAANKVAIEINLYSNQFILHVQDDRHPISLYKQFNVPITISTDDAGVLRSNLIEQYVLLVSRYKNITYKDVKQFVYNSIEYSFIRDGQVKARIKKQLDGQFAAFEKQVAEMVK